MLLCSFKAPDGYQLEGAKQPENENKEQMTTLKKEQQGTEADTRHCKSTGKTGVKKAKDKMTQKERARIWQVDNQSEMRGERNERNGKNLFNI